MQALKQLRKMKGETQKQFGEAIGANWRTVCMWENGHWMPPSKKLQEIAKHLGVEIGDLFKEVA